MKSYRCHKVVQAAKIIGIEDDLVNHTGRHLALDDGTTIVANWVHFKNARVDGYYVLYETGYDLYLSAEVFEKGYAEVDVRKHNSEVVENYVERNLSYIYELLLRTWTTEHDRPMPYRKSVEIYAILAKLPDEERDRLLAFGD